MAKRKATYFGHQSEKVGTLELDSCSLPLILHFLVSLLSAANVRCHFPLPLTLDVFCYLIKNIQTKQELCKKSATTRVCRVMLLVAAK
jgi:hypothetical protein